MPRPTSRVPTSRAVPRPLVAVILDAARPYDRMIIAGVARFVRERRSWSLYVEEDPLAKIPDLRRWNGRGIIANFDDRHVSEAIRGLGVPVVGVGGGYGWYEAESAIPYVYTDNAVIGKLGAGHLLSCGFKQLAFLGYPPTRINGWSAERAQAFEASARRAGRLCNVFTGRHATPRDWADMQRDLAAWIAALPKPVGIMACNDVRARHALEACRTLGLQVPHDVAVIGVDNDEMICELTDPPLSSVDQAARRIGYEAAGILDRLMSGKQPARGRRRAEGRIIVPPVGVVPRASTDTFASSDAAVVRTLNRLHENPFRKPDVGELAEQLGLSRPTLEARFRGVVGRSIHDEFVRLRVARLRELIVGTDMQLKMVARRAGFKSVQYMTTFFHGHTGITPAKLRMAEGRPLDAELDA